MKKGLLPLAIVFTIYSCKKDPGPGGLATIRGKIYGIDLTTSGDVKDSGYLGNQRVFIGVAGEPAHFDDVRSSYDGSFEFKFLRKGSYDVWTFGDCDTCTWKQQKVMVSGVEISEKKQTVEVGDMKVLF